MEGLRFESLNLTVLFTKLYTVIQIDISKQLTVNAITIIK